MYRTGWQMLCDLEDSGIPAILIKMIEISDKKG